MPPPTSACEPSWQPTATPSGTATASTPMATACCSSDQQGARFQAGIAGISLFPAVFPLLSHFSTFPRLFHICTSIHSFLHHSCALPRLLSRPTLNPCHRRITSGQPACLRTGSPPHATGVLMPGLPALALVTPLNPLTTRSFREFHSNFPCFSVNLPSTFPKQGVFAEATQFLVLYT